MDCTRCSGSCLAKSRSPRPTTATSTTRGAQTRCGPKSWRRSTRRRWCARASRNISVLFKKNLTKTKPRRFPRFPQSSLSLNRRTTSFSRRSEPRRKKHLLNTNRHRSKLQEEATQELAEKCLHRHRQGSHRSRHCFEVFPILPLRGFQMSVTMTHSNGREQSSPRWSESSSLRTGRKKSPNVS